MNNEPVAWMETYKGEPNNLDWDKNNLYCGGEFHNVVPLYTHPVKELTMAEIEDFINAYGLDMGDVYEFSLAQLTKMIVEIEHQIRGEK